MGLIEEWVNKNNRDNNDLRKYLARASKGKDKSLNRRADQLHEEVFEEIDCLDCANCCKSIPPILNDLDIKRAAKFLGIKPNDFKEKYVVVDDDLDMVMKTSPCPFLMEDNKCLIYEGRPRACREYPHTDNYEFVKNIKLHRKNLEYCPAVYHIVKRLTGPE